jgi:hypothetical protein
MATRLASSRPPAPPVASRSDGARACRAGLPFPVLLGSALLEPRRWIRPVQPRVELRSFLRRILRSFDGVELWEAHWTAATPEDQATFARTSARWLFNSYATLDAEGAQQRAEATRACHLLAAIGVKANFGNSSERLSDEILVAREWALTLPPGCPLLLECHVGTVLEHPATVRRILDLLRPAPVAIIGHPCSTPGWTEWARLLGTDLRHVHLQLRDADNRFTLLESSPDLVAERYRDLLGLGNLASLTLEFTAGATGSGHDDPEELWSNALRDLRFLRRLHRRLQRHTSGPFPSPLPTRTSR